MSVQYALFSYISGNSSGSFAYDRDVFCDMVVSVSVHVMVRTLCTFVHTHHWNKAKLIKMFLV